MPTIGISPRAEVIKKRISTLDGLRGIAIFMVILAHFEGTLPSGYSGWLYPLRWFCNGGTGVQIFFVLSGYLISSILIREYDTIGKLDIKAFYLRRIFRIFPAFYLYLAFLLVLEAMGAIHIPGIFLGFAAIHLINYSQALVLLFHLPQTAMPDYWFIGHFWTLSLEEQFYWIWPVSLLFLLRTRKYGVLLGVILAMPVIRLVSYFLFPGERGQLGMMLHSSSDGIFSGCLLAICLARHPEWCKKLLLPPWAVAALPLYLFFGDPLLNGIMPRGFGMIIGIMLVLAAIVLLLNNVLLQENTWYHRVLENGALVFLGRISYSVYLWQQVFLTPLNTTFLGKWPINIVASLLVGWLSYQLVEVPFIRLKDRFFPAHLKRTDSAQVSTPARIGS